MTYTCVEYATRVAQYPGNGQWYMVILAEAQDVPGAMPDEDCLDLFFGPLRDRVRFVEINRDRADETAMAVLVCEQGYPDRDTARDALRGIFAEIVGRPCVTAAAQA